ncbi:MAG: FecR domain-containing protein [Acidobacteriota bacterium]
MAVIVVTPVIAQDIISARAGLINLAEGSVNVNGEEVRHEGDHYQSMKEGDSLSTDRGRAEILLNVGTFLRLGDNSEVRLVSAQLEDTRVEILSGSAIIEVAELPKDTSVEITMQGAKASLKKRGLYEFNAGDGGHVRVYDGELALNTAPGQEVRPDQRAGTGSEFAHAHRHQVRRRRSELCPLSLGRSPSPHRWPQATRSEAASFSSQSSYNRAM